MDDPNGVVTNLDNNGNDLGTANVQVGDPEWVGMLEHPDAPHGPNNRFVSRYAFIAVPVGNTLDLNAIHNQVLDEPSTPLGGTSLVNPGANTHDGFFRNEGVGSWEINLAAFLADLNTNQWGRLSAQAVWLSHRHRRFQRIITNTMSLSVIPTKVMPSTMPVRCWLIATRTITTRSIR